MPSPSFSGTNQTIGLGLIPSSYPRLQGPYLPPLILYYLPMGGPSIFRPRRQTLEMTAIKLAKLYFPLSPFLSSLHSCHFTFLLLCPFPISMGRVNSLWSQCFQGPQTKKKVSKGRINIIWLEHDNKLHNFISNFALGKGWRETFEETWNRP